MSYDLIILGDLVADVIIPIERLPLAALQHGWAEGLFVEPGGAGNGLVAARRMGLHTATLGSIGPDRYGAEMIELLKAEGVVADHVLVCGDRQTVVCIVMTDTLGQHVYLGVKDKIGYWPFPAEWHGVIERSRALFTDGYTVRDVLRPSDLLAALASARRGGAPVFFDPGPSITFIAPELIAQVLAATDVLLLTDDEAEYLCQARDRAGMARELLARGPGTVVIKHGAEGCSVTTASERITHPGFPVEMVDTVGAGDSFAAAFIAGWLRGGSLADCAALANAMGALVVTQRGAGTRIPPRERLLDLLVDAPAARALV